LLYCISAGHILHLSAIWSKCTKSNCFLNKLTAQ
jgi:hypothetical protein